MVGDAHQIELARAEVKYRQARLAILEAQAAYLEILTSKGTPYRDVEDRVLMLTLALSAIERLPQSLSSRMGAAPDSPPSGGSSGLKRQCL